VRPGLVLVEKERMAKGLVPAVKAVEEEEKGLVMAAKEAETAVRVLERAEETVLAAVKAAAEHLVAAEVVKDKEALVKEDLKADPATVPAAVVKVRPAGTEVPARERAAEAVKAVPAAEAGRQTAKAVQPEVRLRERMLRNRRAAKKIKRKKATRLVLAAAIQQKDPEQGGRIRNQILSKRLAREKLLLLQGLADRQAIRRKVERRGVPIKREALRI